MPPSLDVPLRLAIAVTALLPFEVVAKLRTDTEAAYAEHKVDVAVGLAISALNATNKYLTDTEPWKKKAETTDEVRRAIIRP